MTEHMTIDRISADWRAFDSFIRATPEQRQKAMELTTAHLRIT